MQKNKIGNGDLRDIAGWLLVVCVFGAVIASGKELNVIASVLNFLSGILALLFVVDSPQKFLHVTGDVFVFILALSGLLSQTLLIWNPLNFPVVGVSLSHFLLFFVAIIAFLRSWTPADIEND